LHQISIVDFSLSEAKPVSYADSLVEIVPQKSDITEF
jgi:hypothetical protein